MVVLVTATLVPDHRVFRLKLIEKDERIVEYVRGLKYLINVENIDKIVFCDNSGDVDAFHKLDLEIEKEPNKKKLELLQFDGNNERIIEQGKGFGEGEIIEYALEHSKFMKGEDEFIKITGRIIIKNIGNIIKKMESKLFYINPVKIYGSDRQMDTKFYKISKTDYVKNFLMLYKNVNDKNGIFIEHLFLDAIKQKKISYKNTPEYPIYIGRSGSGGGNYGTSNLKYQIKNIMCQLNIYKNC